MDKSKRINKINAVLKEGWYDNLVTKISHKFGVGDPEAAVAERFGTGVGKRELQSIMSDPKKHAEWMGKHEKESEELSGIENKVKTAKYATVGAAAGLGALAAAPLLPSVIPAARATLPYVTPSLPRVLSPANVGIGAAAAYRAGMASKSSPTATKYVNRAQGVADWLTLVPGPQSAVVDSLSGMVDLAQGEPKSAANRFTSAGLALIPGGKLQGGLQKARKTGVALADVSKDFVLPETEEDKKMNEKDESFYRMQKINEYLYESRKGQILNVGKNSGKAIINSPWFRDLLIYAGLQTASSMFAPKPTPETPLRMIGPGSSMNINVSPRDERREEKDRKRRSFATLRGNPLYNNNPSEI